MDWRRLPCPFFWIYFSISSCSCSVSWFLIGWQCWNIKCQVKFSLKTLDWFGKCRAVVTTWNFEIFLNFKLQSAISIDAKCSIAVGACSVSCHLCHLGQYPIQHMATWRTVLTAAEWTIECRTHFPCTGSMWDVSCNIYWYFIVRYYVICQCNGIALNWNCQCNWINIVKLRRGSGKDRQGMAPKAKGLKA